MSGPSIKRFFPLGHKLVTLVDGGDAGDRASRVVQDLVGHMWSYPELRHAGDRCPAEVMKRQPETPAFLSSFGLAWTKLRNGLSPVPNT